MVRIHHVFVALTVVAVLIVEGSNAQPIWDRFTQLVFEPNRLNYWYTAWEKLFHMGRYHIHNIPKMVTLPFHGANRISSTIHKSRH